MNKTFLFTNKINFKTNMDDTKINSQHHIRPGTENPRQQSGRLKSQTPNKVLFNEKPFYGYVAVSRGVTWRRAVTGR